MATSVIRSTASIVEQGTSGTWFYRKWSDGKAECWGYENVTSISITSAYGSAFYGSARTMNFPSGLFATPPSLTVNLHSGDGSWAGVYDWTKDNYSYYPYCAKSGTHSYYETCYAIGRWK